MKKSILVAVMLFSSNLFAMNNSNHNMMDHSKHMNHNMSMPEVKQHNEKDVELAKKGKKVFETMCNKDSLKEFDSKASAKEFLQKNCQNIKDDRLEAASTYLYFPSLANEKSQMLDIPQDAKCPVCGMFVAKFDKWASMVQVDKNSYYFDGVIDMMKLYFEPSKYVKDLSLNKDSIIKVTDYYTLEAIDAKSAFYVVGSNVYGPMGKELIPFKSESQAKEFLKDHFGQNILKFEEITKEHLSR